MIRFLFAAATALFVLSLPMSKTEFGATLRRWAGFCLALALLPSILCSLFFASAPSTNGPLPHPLPPTASPFSTVTTYFAMFGLFVLLALGAYTILRLRKAFSEPKKEKDPWEAYFARGGGGKRRVRFEDDVDDDPFSERRR